MKTENLINQEEKQELIDEFKKADDIYTRELIEDYYKLEFQKQSESMSYKVELIPTEEISGVFYDEWRHLGTINLGKYTKSKFSNDKLKDYEVFGWKGQLSSSGLISYNHYEIFDSLQKIMDSIFTEIVDDSDELKNIYDCLDQEPELVEEFLNADSSYIKTAKSKNYKIELQKSYDDEMKFYIQVIPSDFIAKYYSDDSFEVGYVELKNPSWDVGVGWYETFPYKIDYNPNGEAYTNNAMEPYEAGQPWDHLEDMLSDIFYEVEELETYDDYFEMAYEEAKNNEENEKNELIDNEN